MSTGDQAANEGIFGDMADLFPEIVTPPNHKKPPVAPQFTGTAATPEPERTVSMYPEVSIGDGLSLDELDAAMGFDKLKDKPRSL